MPQALDNVNDLLQQQFSIGLLPPGTAAAVPPQAPQYVEKQMGFQQQQQSLGNVLQEAPPPGVVAGGDPSLAALPEWDPATMGTMDWTAGYENILNLMQDELQILENYPNAGLF